MQILLQNLVIAVALKKQNTIGKEILSATYMVALILQTPSTEEHIDIVLYYTACIPVST